MRSSRWAARTCTVYHAATALVLQRREAIYKLAKKHLIRYTIKNAFAAQSGLTFNNSYLLLESMFFFPKVHNVGVGRLALPKNKEKGQRESWRSCPPGPYSSSLSESANNKKVVKERRRLSCCDPYILIGTSCKNPNYFRFRCFVTCLESYVFWWCLRYLVSHLPSQVGRRIRDFEKLYDLVKNQRNKFVNLIQVRQCTIVCAVPGRMQVCGTVGEAYSYRYSVGTP